MKFAVRTGVLSKLWINVWRDVDSVVFVYDNWDDQDLPGFVKFVNNSVHKLNSESLDMFSLFIKVGGFRPTLVDEWLSLVLKKRSQILKLELTCSYSVPDWFYKNPDILDMTIHLCQWNYNSQQGLGSLRKLHLSCVTLSDEGVSKILLGCPRLHTLVFTKVSIANLNIKNETMEHLKLIDLKRHESSDYVRVNVPFVMSLEIIGSAFEPHCLLIDVSFLENVLFDYEYLPPPFEGLGSCEWLDTGAKLLKDANGSKSLILGPVFIKIISVLTITGASICSLKCRNANLRSQFQVEDLPCILSLLSHSRVETLTVDVVAPDQRIFANICGFHPLSWAKDGDSIVRSFEGNLSNLKSVVVFLEGNNDCGGARSFAFKFVAFLLRKVRKLKKLELASKSDHDLEKLTLFSERLVSLLLKGNIARTWDLKTSKSGFKFILH